MIYTHVLNRGGKGVKSPVDNKHGHVLTPGRYVGACLAGRQAKLDAASCLPKLRRRQVAANLKELGYGG